MVAVVVDKLRAFRDVLIFLYDIKTENRFEATRTARSIEPIVLSACLQPGLLSCCDQGIGTARGQNGCDGLIP